MSITTTNRSYDAVAKSLHWVIVLMVLWQYVTKLVPAAALGVTRGGMNYWHSAVGPVILLLMILRLAWRLTHKVPPTPSDLPPALQILARATHWTFYGLLIAMPILGWLAISGYGGRPTLLGLFTLPALADKNREAGEAWGTAHAYLSWVLLAVIALHFVGAMYHLFVKKDGVAQRMLPGGAADML